MEHALIFDLSSTTAARRIQPESTTSTSPQQRQGPAVMAAKLPSTGELQRLHSANPCANKRHRQRRETGVTNLHQLFASPRPSQDPKPTTQADQNSSSGGRGGGDLLPPNQSQGKASCVPSAVIFRPPSPTPSQGEKQSWPGTATVAGRIAFASPSAPPGRFRPRFPCPSHSRSRPRPRRRRRQALGCPCASPGSPQRLPRATRGPLAGPGKGIACRSYRHGCRARRRSRPRRCRGRRRYRLRRAPSRCDT